MADVFVAPEAEAQLRHIDTWWRRNRKAAPEVFLDEFERACADLSVMPRMPRMGRRMLHFDVKGVRRVPLKKSRKHVYYVTDGNAVFVLAVWNAIGGGEPDLSEVMDNLPLDEEGAV